MTGVLTLVVTLVEIIEEALETQAVRRLESGDLTEQEQDRLGEALLELDEAMKEIKAEHGITTSVADLRTCPPILWVGGSTACRYISCTSRRG